MFVRSTATIGIALLCTSLGAQEAARRFSLEDLLAIARAKSPAILSAERRVEALRGSRTAAATPSALEVEFARGTGRSWDGLSSRTERGFQVSQSLEWPWRWRARVRAADQSVLAGQAANLATEAEVLASVREQFYGILYAQGEATLLGEQARAADDLLALAEKRVEVGEGRELDRIKAQVEAQRMRRLEEAAQSDLRVRKAVLDRWLLGELGPDAQFVGGASLPDSIPDRTSVIARILASSPALREARAGAEAAGWTLKAERQGRFPDLTATYSKAEELDRKSNSVALLFRVPLWGFNAGPIRQAAAEREAALQNESLLRAEVGARAEEACKAYELAFAQARSFQMEVLPAARKALDIATFSYRQGEVSLLDLLDARRTYLDAAESSNEVILQFHIARSELERLLGGPLHD